MQLNMLIRANFVPPRLGQFYTPWERADYYVDTSYRPFVADARASAQLLWLYMHSYRQSDNIALKAKFWKLYLQFIDSLGRLYNVPTRKNAQRENPNTSFEQLQFLNLRLTEEQMELMDNTKVTPAQLVTSLAAVIEGGLAFSLNWNNDREIANATFMDKRLDSPCKGYALSAFGTDVTDALKILLYKHLNILGGDWKELIGKPQNTNRRG